MKVYKTVLLYKVVKKQSLFVKMVCHKNRWNLKHNLSYDIDVMITILFI